ncbi:MAG: RidA family protein [Arenicellales bacterium]
MNQSGNPGNVHPPLGAYTHAIEVPAGARWLLISGQVGMDGKGRLARGIAAQSERAMRNILACLRAAGMSKRDLVKTTTYLTDARFVTPFRDARRKVFGDECAPTSTLVIVDALAAPELLVEVEAWAAKA